MLALYAHPYEPDRSGNPPKARDLTGWVSSIEVMLSTSEPWTLINATLTLPHANRGLAPDSGDWLVVRGVPSGQAIAMGKMEAPTEPGLVREGAALVSGKTRLVARSWLTSLQDAEVYAHGSASRLTSVGTLFTLDEWEKRANEILNVVNGRHGEQLVKLLRLLGRMSLPPSLGRGQLGFSVAVAHDSQTSQRLGLLSPVDSVLGPRLAGDQAWPGATSALALLRGLFQPNRELVELFEVMAPLDRRRGGTADQIESETREIEARRLESQQMLGEPAESSAELERIKAEVDYLNASGAIVGDGALVGKLRAVPTLVYRLRPWRTESLADYLAAEKGRGSPQQIASLDRAIEVFEKSFPSATWPKPRYTFTEDEIVAFDPPSHPSRVNAVTIDPVMASDAIKFWEEAGLPMLDETDIARHGLRVMSPRWPYFAEGDADFVAWLRLMAGVASQLFLRQERFYQGTVQVRSRLDVQPGNVFRLRLPGGRSFTAYAETVRHSLSRQGTVLAGWTYITYSRGLYDGEARSARPDAPVERGTEPERPAKRATSLPVVGGPARPQPPGPATSVPPTTTTNIGVRYRGVDLAWTGPHPIEQRFSKVAPADKTKRRSPQAIDILTLHFTGGRSLDVKDAIRELDKGGGDGAHFIVQPDGRLFQYLDLETTATHVGQDDLNRRSVGIEIMSPGAALTVDPAAPSLGPWQKLTGFFYGSQVAFRNRHFYAATTQQEETVVALIRFLSANFGVTLASPAADVVDRKHLKVPRRGHRADEPISSGGLGLTITPGVWHHVELYNPPAGRIDAMGIIIPDLVARARTP